MHYSQSYEHEHVRKPSGQQIPYFEASMRGADAVDLGADFGFFFDSSSMFDLSSFLFLFSTLYWTNNDIKLG